MYQQTHLNMAVDQYQAVSNWLRKCQTVSSQSAQWGTKGQFGMAEGRSGIAACSAGVCDDLTSGALYRLSRLSCYMFMLLPFLSYWEAGITANLSLRVLLSLPLFVC